MEPQFRHCTSADGTRIVYATYGEGPPLMSSVINISVDAALTIPEARAFYDALAARAALAIYRGEGGSEQGDIAAVADAL